jgi:YgiT-type zinc finger domain-containing protein
MRRYTDPLTTIPCGECDLGYMRRTTVTHFTFAGGRMITIPNFPAWVCDMCGDCEYDSEALKNLARVVAAPLTRPNAGGKRASRAGKNAGTKPQTPSGN